MRSIGTVAGLSAILAACTLLPAKTMAATSYWDHNGSAMRLEEQGKKRKFVYEQPRGNLAAAGVKNGTVLFEGEEKPDGRLAGYAKLFRKGCDPVDYFVEGALDKSKGQLLLQGQAPIYSGDGCKITGYSDEGSSSSLTFAYRGGGDSNIARGEDLGPDGQGERDSYRTDQTARTGRTDPRNPDTRSYQSPSDDQRATDDRGYLPPQYRNPRTAPRDSQDPGYSQRDPAPRDGQDPSYSQRDPAPRDYADRSQRSRPYDRDDRYDYRRRFPRDVDEDDRDFYDDDYDNEPAYVPYQPFWRRWRNY